MVAAHGLCVSGRTKILLKIGSGWRCCGLGVLFPRRVMVDESPTTRASISSPCLIFAGFKVDTQGVTFFREFYVPACTNTLSSQLVTPHPVYSISPQKVFLYLLSRLTNPRQYRYPLHVMCLWEKIKPPDLIDSISTSPLAQDIPQIPCLGMYVAADIHDSPRAKVQQLIQK